MGASLIVAGELWSRLRPRAIAVLVRFALGKNFHFRQKFYVVLNNFAKSVD